MKEKKEEELSKTKKIEVNDIKKAEKNSNGLLITLLVILLLGVFFAFGYAIGGTRIISEVNKNDTKENTNKKESNSSETPVEEEKVTFTDSELKEYVDYIMPISGNGPSAKIFNVNKVVASELSARDKIEYTGHEIYKNRTTSSDYAYDIISEDIVKNRVEEVFGEGTYERTIFNLGCGDYIFHEDDNKFYSKTGCGGTTDTLVENLPIDYKATKNKLEITTAYAFADSNNKVYKDYNKQNAVADVTVEMNQVSEFLTDYVKNHKDELNHIVYVFESKDGIHYYFKELTNNK